MQSYPDILNCCFVFMGLVPLNHKAIIGAYLLRGQFSHMTLLYLVEPDGCAASLRLLDSRRGVGRATTTIMPSSPQSH